MEDQQNRKEAIENVISRKHFNYLGSLDGRAKSLHYNSLKFRNQVKPVKYPSWEDSESCRGPDAQKQPEHDVAESGQLGVVEHLGKLEENVTAVVGQEHERAAPKSVNIQIWINNDLIELSNLF